MNDYLLSLLIFLPLLAALVLLFIPQNLNHVFKYITLGVSLLQVVLVVGLCQAFESGENSPKGIDIASEYQFVEKIDWISLDLSSLGKLSIDYFVGVDGISVTMVLLAVLVLLIGVIASWNLTEKRKAYFSLYLLLNASIIGCFVALDFFLFYLFFEFMLLPMYFLIGIWGGIRREYASIKFFLYTLLGSILILIVIIGLYISVIDPAATAVSLELAEREAAVTPEMIEKVQQLMASGTLDPSDAVHTFNIVAMADASNFVPGSILSLSGSAHLWGYSARLLAFLALFIGFAIKIPVVPLHTWLPDAHVEAPTPISVILAGILLKIGGYGLIRTGYMIFPDGALYFAWWIGFLGVVSIIYGAFNALSSKDLKKLIAYSSVSHMGFVLLGLASVTSEGVSGAIYQMFSHGIIASMLFLIAGVLYDRTHDRMIAHYSGLAQKMSRFTVIVVIAFFASLGLPGFSGFIAEVLVFLGAFHASDANGLLPKWMAIVATFGLLLSAAYYLWTIQRMFFGKYSISNEKWHDKLQDLQPREYVLFLPLVLATLLLGIFPHLLLDMINQSMGYFVAMVNETGLDNLSKLLDK